MNNARNENLVNGDFPETRNSLNVPAAHCHKKPKIVDNDFPETRNSLNVPAARCHKKPIVIEQTTARDESTK